MQIVQIMLFHHQLIVLGQTLFLEKIKTVLAQFNSIFLQQIITRHNASYIAFLVDKEGVLFLFFINKKAIPPPSHKKPVRTKEERAL